MNNKIKTIAITGSTGGIGREIAFRLAKMGKNLIFVDRNKNKVELLASDIKKMYPDTNIQFVQTDLSNLSSVKSSEKKLQEIKPDALVLNAGVYKVPTKTLDSGYNNIFQINFLSQYYLAKKLIESRSVKKVVATGSIAYKFSKLNLSDIDFSTCKKPIKIYSNSKKFLMFSLIKLAKKTGTELAICNPGITLTSLTANFPKCINWVVKFFMRLIFPSPQKASKNIIYGLLNYCAADEWVTPKILDVWGKPKIKKLKFLDKEIEKIYSISENIFDKTDNNL